MTPTTQRALTVALALVGAAMAWTTAAAEGRAGFCREGRTLTGACVRGDLARQQRVTAIAATQSRLSRTNLPVEPRADSRYRYPNNAQGFDSRGAGHFALGVPYY